MHFLRVILGALSIFSMPLWASSSVSFSPCTVQLGGDWRFKQAYTLQAAFQGQVYRQWALGIRYGQWLGEEGWAWGGQSPQDKLTLQVLGAEIGYRLGNPRLHYFFSLGASVPLQLRIARSGNTPKTFSSASTPFLYEARFQAQLKFIQNISWILEAGYRWVDLGVLSSGSESYEARLELTGPFLGTAIGIHF